MENYDAYSTAGAGNINEDNDNMNISVQENQENVKYQKYFKVNVKNISKNKNNMETNI